MREICIFDMYGHQEIAKNVVSRLPKGEKVTYCGFFDGENPVFPDF